MQSSGLCSLFHCTCSLSGTSSGRTNTASPEVSAPTNKTYLKKWDLISSVWGRRKQDELISVCDKVMTWRNTDILLGALAPAELAESTLQQVLSPVWYHWAQQMIRLAKNSSTPSPTQGLMPWMQSGSHMSCTYSPLLMALPQTPCPAPHLSPHEHKWQAKRQTESEQMEDKQTL